MAGATGRAKGLRPLGRSPHTRRHYSVALQPIKNLVGPEPFEAVQRLIEHAEVIGVDPAHLLHRTHMLFVERIDGVAYFAALVGQLDAYRTPVDPRTLMIEEAHFDQFLEIVGNIGAEV